MKIGFAKDIHRLVKDRQLVLAGVKIPFELGEEAHSDGDVVFHAIMDSILGALALGDIGHFFPDSDQKYKNIDSSLLMKEIYNLMAKHGYSIGNIDVFVCLEKPKIFSFVPKMRENIASLLHTDISNVSIKAGTNEGIGEIGLSKAIEASSIVLLKDDLD